MSIRSNVDRTALNERIRIERRVVAQNPSTGFPSTTWSLVLTCWAKVDGVKASDRRQEPYVAGAEQQSSNDTFWVRSDIPIRAGLTETGFRIVWKGDNYDILDIPSQQLRGRLTPIIARAGLNDG